jgi:hypothetical protein
MRHAAGDGKKPGGKGSEIVSIPLTVSSGFLKRLGSQILGDLTVAGTITEIIIDSRKRSAVQLLKIRLCRRGPG